MAGALRLMLAAAYAVQQSPEWKQRFTDLANTFVMELEHAENQTKFPPTP